MSFGQGVAIGAIPCQMSDIFIPPAGYDRIKVVGSFDELVDSSFGPRVNAICWPRRLAGDFDALAACFSGEGDIVSINRQRLDALRGQLGAGGLTAIDEVLEDQRLLAERGLLPSLECVARYPRDDPSSPVPTDVYSFHADRATVAADTYLCSYNGLSTQALRNEEAVRRMDIPDVRAALESLYRQEGAEEDFEAYLRDHCFDLHYAPLPRAVPFSFGAGNLWRIAIEYPGCPVLPCLHRAPVEAAGQPPRLLLIS